MTTTYLNSFGTFMRAPFLALGLAALLPTSACNRGSSDDAASPSPTTQPTPGQKETKDGERQPALQLTDGGVTLSIKIDRSLAGAATDEASLLMTRQVDVGDYDSAAVYVVVDPAMTASSCYLYYNKQYRVRQNFQKFAIRPLFGMDENTFAASSYDFAFDASHLGMTNDGKLASVAQIASLPGKFLTFWIGTLENGSIAADGESASVPPPAPATATSSTSSPTPSPTLQPVDNTPDCKGEIQFRIYGKRKV